PDGLLAGGFGSLRFEVAALLGFHKVSPHEVDWILFIMSDTAGVSRPFENIQVRLFDLRLGRVLDCLDIRHGVDPAGEAVVEVRLEWEHFKVEMRSGSGPGRSDIADQLAFLDFLAFID